MKKVMLQAMLGIIGVVAAFVGGTMLCEFYLPGTGVKYLNERGEMVVGALTFAVTLAIAVLARFDRRALFITAGLIPALIIGIVLVVHAIAPSYGSGGIDWGGLLGDVLLVCRHTALPVVFSAGVVLLIRMLGAQGGAAAKGRPARRAAGSGVGGGPPSVR